MGGGSREEPADPDTAEEEGVEPGQGSAADDSLVMLNNHGEDPYKGLLLVKSAY